MEIARTTPGITDQIEREYQASKRSYQDAVMHAINVGVLLREAKKLVGHGEWLNYLADNFEFDQQRASEFMRIADNQELAIEANYRHGGNLSVKQMLKLIADESPKARRPRQIQADRVEVIPPAPAIQTTTPETPKLDPAPAESEPIPTGRAGIDSSVDDVVESVARKDVAPDHQPSPAPDAPANNTGDTMAAGAGEELTGQAATNAKEKRLRDAIKAERRTWLEHERYTMAQILREQAEIIWPHRPVEIREV